MNALIRWGLWQKRWTIIWWCIGITAFIALNLVFYPSFKNQSAELNQSLNQLPDSAKALFSDTGDLFSPIGYLSSQVFYLMFPLLLSVLAIGQGASLLGKEERERTIELLMARPVSRGKLLLSKALVGIIILLVAGGVGLIVSTVLANLVGIDVPSVNVALASLMAILMALSFGAVAFAITATGSHGRAASIGVASLIALSGYIIASLAGVVKWLQWPAKVLPFHYYHPAEILGGTFVVKDALLFIAITLVLAIIAFVAFRKRDL